MGACASGRGEHTEIVNRNWTPKSHVSTTGAGVVIEIELGGIIKSAVWITVEERELCIHWREEGDFGASESRFYIPQDYSPESAKASFAKGILRIDVPPNKNALGSKPLPMMIYCKGCGKHFEIIVCKKGPENQRCPHCGEVQVFELDSLVKKAIEQGKKMLKKPGGWR